MMDTSDEINESYGILELCLKDVLNLIKPLETDRELRLSIIERIASILRSQSILEDALVKPFGSFVSNLYTKWGDLDISVDFPVRPHLSAYAARQRQQYFLREITRALRRAGFIHSGVLILSARVPVLTFRSNCRDISCDISIDNHTGQIKSKILLWISDIDERFHDMVLLVKEWAKAQNINNPKQRTLNSYSLCLMVIFHFQTCSPPILPPLKEIYNGNVAVTGTRRIQDVCLANIARFKSEVSRQRNESSLSQLLIEFFDKFSGIDTISSSKAICTYTGQMERLSRTCAFAIEDPFEQTENTARAVDPVGLNTISRAFREAYMKFSSRNIRSDRASLLANLVRPRISSQLGGVIRTEDNGVSSNNETMEDRYRDSLTISTVTI